MSESSIKASFMRRIKKEKFWGELWIYPPMDAQTSGIPDVIFCLNGLFGWIEFKKKHGGRPSPIQLYQHKKLGIAKARGKICRTADEAMDFIRNFYNQKGGDNAGDERGTETGD